MVSTDDSLNKDGDIEISHSKKKLIMQAYMLPLFDFEMVHIIRKNENRLCSVKKFYHIL
jgi:hypothetical protein